MIEIVNIFNNLSLGKIIDLPLFICLKAIKKITNNNKILNHNLSPLTISGDQNTAISIHRKNNEMESFNKLKSLIEKFFLKLVFSLKE